MREFELISSAGRVAVYQLPDRAYGIVLPEIPNRNGFVRPTAESCTALADALVADGVLFLQGDTPVIRNGYGKNRLLHTKDHEAAFVNRHVFVAARHDDEFRDRLDVPTALHADNLDAFTTWRLLCGGNNLTVLDWQSGSSFGAAFRDAHIPIFRGELTHPIVGKLPPGWFAPPPPPEPAGYDHLRRLFASLPLDPAGRAVLYTYLLGAFHTDSLVSPAPLLCVDSQEQAVGKTEAVMAIANIIDTPGEASGVQPPYSRDTEVLTAHFLKGLRLAPMDNLSSVKDYQHPWIASILSDRTAADRPKYGRVTVAFAGRLVALTFILGTATLHRDLISRAWRAELHGPGKPLSHRPNRFAVDNRKELQAQCYHAVLNAPEWALPSSGTRSSEYEARGAAAYASLTGAEPSGVLELLKKAQKNVLGYSTAFLRLLKKERVEFPDPDAVLPVQPGETPAYLRGVTGLGHVATNKGLARYEPEIMQT